MRRSLQSGQSLVQLLVSIGIMGVMMMAFLTMMSSQQRESRALSETLARSDLERLMIASMAEGSVCKWVLNTPTALTIDTTAITPTTPYTVTLPPARPLYANIVSGPVPAPGPVIATVGSAASSFSNTVVISSIQLQVTSGAGSTYLGNWLVNFDNTKTVRTLRPATVSAKLTVDPTVPNAAVVTDCQVSGGVATFQNCVMRKSTSATMGTCGYSSQVLCLANETAISGGMYGGANLTLQNSEALTNAAGAPIGWEITTYDVANPECSGNALTPVGTIANGSAPCFPISGGSSNMCGAAFAICCH